MKLILDKLKKYGFNRRELSESDFYAVCEKEKITVLEMEVSCSFYMNVGGKAFIVLKKNLRGLKRTFTMFHELAHHFLHGGRGVNQAFYFGLLDNKQEFEADRIALIALIPLSCLNSFDFLEDHPNRYAKKLYRERQRLYFLYGV